ncbi:MAG: protein-disulfide reductase DsbD family protein [Amaricoccus sp.]|uniref:protein-disulfide reductase DsbD domain-containing protein n=1 Tax=Amaricoccus sp. TaxID=1872485 RepID=UPI0039E4C72C
MRPLALVLAGLALATPAFSEDAGAEVAGASFSAPSAPAAAPSMRLLAGWRAPDGTRVAAIEIALAPGWHTYWRVPGEAGIPPSFDWSGSRNLAAVSYEWPRPEVFDTEGMQTFGYERRLVLPVRLHPADPGAPMQVALDADIGVCSDICMAAQATAALQLGPDTPEDSRGEIEAALADRLQSPAEAGVVRTTCTLASGADGDEIVATVTFASATDPGQIAIIEPGRPDIWVGSPDTRVEGRTLTASAPMEALGTGGSMIARDAVRLTLLGAERAIDIRGCDAPS